MPGLKLPQGFGQYIRENQQWLRGFIRPLLILSVAFLLAYSCGLDQFSAQVLFGLQGNHWQLKEHWLTETVLHQSVRKLNLVLLLVLCGYWLTKWLRGKTSATWRALGVLLLSVILCFGGIALLKRLIPMECPWDLQAFGGTSPFVGLFTQRPSSMVANQCFPAGHASIGYGWLGLYFFLRLLRPALAVTGLFGSIFLGVLLGLTQQIRGAHFLSHDIATAFICWLIAGLCFCRFYPPHILFTAYRCSTNPLALTNKDKSTGLDQNSTDSKESTND